MQQWKGLFDHLVGKGEQLVGNLETECPCRFEIDHQLKFVRRLDGKLLRFRAAKDAINIGSNLPMRLGRIGSVRNQAR